MPYYVDPNGILYWLDSENDAGVLPAGSVEITEEEARLIQYPPQTDEQLASEARALRDSYLRSCDGVTTEYRDHETMINAGVQIEHKYSVEQYMEVLDIKQQLRDITSQAGFPREIIWPERPEWL